jgi:hypothetical protein
MLPTGVNDILNRASRPSVSFGKLPRPASLAPASSGADDFQVFIVKIQLVSKKLLSGESSSRQARVIVMVRSAQYVIQLVCDHPAQSAAEQLIRTAKLRTPH